MRRWLTAEQGLFERVGVEIGGAAWLRDSADERYFDRLGQQVDRLLASTDAVASGMGMLLDLQLNERAYVVSVLATIFVPLTLVTGYFGMNFGWLVDHIDSPLAFWLLGIVLPIATGLLAWRLLVRPFLVGGGINPERVTTASPARLDGGRHGARDDHPSRRLPRSHPAGASLRWSPVDRGVRAHEPRVAVPAVPDRDPLAGAEDGALPDGGRPPRPRGGRCFRRGDVRGGRRGPVRARPGAPVHGRGRRRGGRRVAGARPVGAVLVDAVAARAREEGLRTFTAVMLADNRAMRRLL